jgi:hypothetical protein
MAAALSAGGGRQAGASAAGRPERSALERVARKVVQ